MTSSRNGRQKKPGSCETADSRGGKMYKYFSIIIMNVPKWTDGAVMRREKMLLVIMLQDIHNTMKVLQSMTSGKFDKSDERRLTTMLPRSNR